MLRLFRAVLLVKVANGLVIGALPRRPVCNLQMKAIPATLQFSGFQGYFVVLNEGEEVQIPTARVGWGLVMGDHVMFDIDASVDVPLVTAAPPSEVVPAEDNIDSVCLILGIGRVA
eukprot:3913257-Prymnesium_polylepis.1